jgi:hypothetical protein
MYFGMVEPIGHAHSAMTGRVLGMTNWMVYFMLFVC